MSRLLRPAAALAASCAAALALGCESGGVARSLGIAAAGTVTTRVVYDANGSQSLDAADTPLPGARVRLLTPGTRDTLLRGETLDDGRASFAAVPVGSYAVVVDSVSVGDTARVLLVTPPTIVVRPDSAVEVTVVVGVPRVTVAEARTRPVGTRVVVAGVALHARTTFGDTLLHVVDATGAIRAARIRPTAAVAGDSVLVRGRIGVRLGQPVLDDVSVFTVTATLIPTVPTVTTAAAAAGGAALDAQLVRILDAAVVDTVTTGGNLTMRVNDGSGPLRVVLDRAADVAFRPPFPAATYSPPTRFDLLGILVPTGTGTWVLRPRSALDLVRR